MKFKVLLLVLVLIVVALLVFLGNSFNLFNNQEKESSSMRALEIWIPGHSEEGMKTVREHIRNVEQKLEAMSGPLTNETFKSISEFFRNRGFIITHDRKLVRGSAIPGYLKSNWENIDEINFGLAYFVSEEFPDILNLPPGQQEHTDVIHVVHLGFRVSYVLEDGEPIDPGGGRDDRHIRDCTWIE